MLNLFDWTFFVCWERSFTVLDTKVTFFYLFNLGSGFPPLGS
jgi:hypothetical protein